MSTQDGAEPGDGLQGLIPVTGERYGAAVDVGVRGVYAGGHQQDATLVPEGAVLAVVDQGDE